MSISLDDLRTYYAEEIRAVANLKTEALITALAKVPRERFLGPGPWKIANPEALQSPTGHGKRANYRTTPDDNPRHLYHNVVVAIDAERQLNNGQPATLATFIDALELRAGNRVVHIGCGVGYYTAIIAETVGPQGRVVGVELDAELAGRAKENLSYLSQAEAVHADGGEYELQPVDALLVNAGATHPRTRWLDSLLPGGRLLIPLTIGQDENVHGVGLMLKIKREQNGYSARFISSVMIFPCIGSRDEEANQRLREAMMKGTWASVQSLRRDKHEAAESCWFHGNDYCLSTLSNEEQVNTTAR